MARRLSALLVSFSFLIAVSVAGCGGSSSRPPAVQEEPKPKIGLLMDTLEGRWKRDRDLFVERAKQLGAEVLVEAADFDDAKQLQQAESLLARGVQVLVVVPHSSEAAGQIVEAAKKRSVPVISYDRLILKADVELYFSYDNRKVGEQQAQHLRNRAPRGTISCSAVRPPITTPSSFAKVRSPRSRTASNARRSESSPIRGPPTGRPRPPRKLTEAALKKARNQVVAVVASNDITAGGAIEALEKARPGREGARLGSGCEPGRRPSHRRRHADRDGL